MKKAIKAIAEQTLESQTDNAANYVVTMTSGETHAATSLAEAKAYAKAQGLEPVEADGRWECWRSESDACHEAVIKLAR